MAFFELPMRYDPSGIINLPVGYEGFFTGRTGDCTVLIALWDYNGERGYFQNMRGIHVLGGAGYMLQGDENPLAAAFFDGVANSTNTKMIAIGWTLLGSAGQRFESERVERLHRESLPQAILTQGQAPSAYIYKNGLVVGPMARAPMSPNDATEYLTASNTWEKIAAAGKRESKGVSKSKGLPSVTPANTKIGGKGCCVIL